jgi:hypothetical protein
MLDFSMYQSGVDSNQRSLFKPSVKALNPLNRLNAIFVQYRIGTQNRLIYLIGT